MSRAPTRNTNRVLATLLVVVLASCGRTAVAQTVRTLNDVQRLPAVSSQSRGGSVPTISPTARGVSSFVPPLAPPNATNRPANPPRFSPAAAVGGDFPSLPPDPYQSKKDKLPPLDEELARHGGSYLYETEDEKAHLRESFGHGEEHGHHYRLPEYWQEPEPVTGFTRFQSTGLIDTSWRWFGGGYAWEPRFVAYGSYSVFGVALEQNNQRQDIVGHQLLVDLDLRLTGTERFHVQFRPLGRGGSGGSFYQFSNPNGYVDNATGTPDRFWAEGELHSLLGAFVDPFAPLDIHMTVGKFPIVMHNFLLVNDDILGVAVSKNSLYVGSLSNVNVQLIYAFNDVDVFGVEEGRMYAAHVTADDRGRFWETTYAFLSHDANPGLDRHYFALSRTAMFGPTSVALRGLFKWGDAAGSGDGQLFVVESNHTRYLDHKPLGVESAVFYCNAFLATSGWSSMGGGNFNRLQTPFEVSPLVRIATGIPSDDTYGVSLGVQLFRHGKDESFAPELSYEAPNDEPVGGLGFRYRRQTTTRSFLELFGAFTFSDDPLYDREGATLLHTIIF